QLVYAARDAAALLPLHTSLTAKIKSAGLERTAEIEHRCLPGLVWLATSGVPFDRAAWTALTKAAAQEAADLAARLAEQAPPMPGEGVAPAVKTRLAPAAAWTWNSPAQVKAAFGLLGVVLEGTGDEALASLEDHPDPTVAGLAGALRKYRASSKLAGTYGAE